MLIHKCKLMLVTSCNLNNKTLFVKLNNNKEFVIENYEGPLFKCGRACILNINSRNQISDMYLLDINNKPFQVHGKFDILLEGCVIYDNTKELLKENAYATQICVNAFGSLFKNEIENHKDTLLSLENLIFDFILQNNLGWKSSKKKIIELIKESDLPDELMSRISNQISIAPMPKAALEKKPTVNLEDYVDSVFVRL